MDIKVLLKGKDNQVKGAYFKTFHEVMKYLEDEVESCNEWREGSNNIPCVPNYDYYIELSDCECN